MNGTRSFVPRQKNTRDKSSVHNRDDEDEEKTYLVTPHTPCSARFFAMQRWIYGSSRAYTRCPPFSLTDVLATATTTAP